MGKKIGLCICYNTKNYGSMLQSLATIKILEQLGYSYEIIKYSRKLTLGFILRSLNRLPEFVKSKVNNKQETKRLNSYPAIKQGIEIRNNRFQDFVNENFKFFKNCDTFKQLKTIAITYDTVLVGSDQLWLPSGYSTGFYNLLFVPKNIKKVSYATSFGVSQIPKSKRKIAKKFLSRFDFLSVREIQGKQIIKNLINKEAEVVLDPTLLFSATDWIELIPKQNVIDIDKYIFCYFLGDNPSYRNAVINFSKSTGLKVVFIPYLDNFVETDLNFGDYQLYNVGPNDFVNLIRNATYVMTDSFHGSVFSILNHKKFVTFKRFENNNKNSRNSRIESLFFQLGLLGCIYENSIENITSKEIDYNAVEQKLLNIRKESNRFLKTALAYEDNKVC